MKSLARLLRALLRSSPLPVCADHTSQVKAALTYDREKMPEELEVSSSSEQGQVVKSFLCKRHCAAQAQYGCVAGRTLARQTFLTPTASTLLHVLPPPDGD